MDPVTHTFVGASLSATGLRRTTPLATATLVAGANAPDVDLAFQVLGPYTALALRRGLTHGVPALVVLPLLTAGAILAWDRWLRRRRRPDAPPARPGAVVGLAYLGVWTHPFLDWLNTYGMRWLMPLDGRWSYGDALFIVDPWVWLLLGGALFLVHSSSLGARAAWGLLAALMTLLIVGSGLVPLRAQLVWGAGLAGWILLRIRLGPGREAGKERAVRWSLALASVYIILMVAQTPLAERSVRAQAAELGVEPVEDVMVGPVPARPLHGEVIVRTPEAYHRGAFRWLPSPRLTLDGETHPRPSPTPVIEAARAHPDARNYLVWSRFPWYGVRQEGDGWLVEIGDARYPDLRRRTGLGGLTVRVGPDLRPVPSGDER